MIAPVSEHVMSRFDVGTERFSKTGIGFLKSLSDADAYACRPHLYLI